MRSGTRVAMRDRLLLAVLLAVSPLVAPQQAIHGQERPLPDLPAFLQAVRIHLQSDALRQSPYVFVETRRDVTRNPGTGAVESEVVNRYESYPGLPDRPRWKRQLVKNGRSVPAADLAAQDRERQAHVLRYVAHMERASVAARASEARRRETQRRENEAGVDEVFRLYDSRMLGRAVIGGYDTIALTFQPKRGAAPRTRDGRLLTKFSGTAWISESEFEVVRLEVEAIDTVSVGLGVLARIHKGSRLAFDRRTPAARAFAALAGAQSERSDAPARVARRHRSPAP